MSNPSVATPLLLIHRRKIIASACVLVPDCLIILFPEKAGRIFGIDEWQVALAAAIIFAIILFILARGMKCPACGVINWKAAELVYAPGYQPGIPYKFGPTDLPLVAAIYFWH